MKINDFDPEVRKALVADLQRGAEKLTESVQNSGKIIEKNLFLMNAGGVVAILSFMGTSEAVRKMQLPMFSLRCFVIGLIFCGAMNAAGFFYALKSVRIFIKNNLQFYENQITVVEWQQVANSIQKHILLTIAFAFGWVSFISFIAGALPSLFLAFK